jgi:hypothetical protein
VFGVRRLFCIRSLAARPPPRVARLGNPPTSYRYSLMNTDPIDMAVCSFDSSEAVPSHSVVSEYVTSYSAGWYLVLSKIRKNLQISTVKSNLHIAKGNAVRRTWQGSNLQPSADLFSPRATENRCATIAPHVLTMWSL